MQLRKNIIVIGTVILIGIGGYTGYNFSIKPAKNENIVATSTINSEYKIDIITSTGTLLGKQIELTIDGENKVYAIKNGSGDIIYEGGFLLNTNLSNDTNYIIFQLNDKFAMLKPPYLFSNDKGEFLKYFDQQSNGVPFTDILFFDSKKAIEKYIRGDEKNTMKQINDDIINNLIYIQL